ncbi:S1C family serine protease [Marinicella gelatinilytica]|uniref:S1C family serine protease n=1 Tax=Marinicella gelatinilytica TaxID=2996017 RepID=UPI00226082CF|nr:trypsin-like peptidase domain-containing protein [Marinicella gelatinilytica]MCX7545274.1 trypsin-like peptidase domain-containing protein [Marinicella gelatinilytica]
MKEHVSFVLKSVILGLALGFLYIWFFGSNLKTVNPAGSAPFSYASAINRITPSVVSIYIQSNELIRNPGGGVSPQAPFVNKNYLGSGVIVSETGHIVTNRHVIDDARRVVVSLWTNEQFEASFVGADEFTDLAVIKIDAKNLVPAQFTDSDAANTGDVVLAVGNPYGLNQSASLGIISATGRQGLNISAVENLIQTDAAINQGNSGGALINTLGEVVGISTASYNQIGAEGINFAIPANTAAQVVQSVIKYGKVIRSGLGLMFLGDYDHMRFRIPKPDKGIMVSYVVPKSPAEKQGIQSRDVITHVNNIAVNSFQEYRQAALSFTLDEKVTLRGFNKDGEFSKTLVVELPTQN